MFSRINDEVPCWHHSEWRALKTTIPPNKATISRTRKAGHLMPATRVVKGHPWSIHCE